jgi:cytochrome c biogenesis protein CcdA
MSAAFAFAFTAGVLAAFNPCGFAMLPAWIGYFLAGEDERPPRDLLARVGRALWVAGLLSLGFLVVFGVAAAIVDVGLVLLSRILPIVTVMLAAVLAAAGGLILARGHFPGIGVLHVAAQRRRGPKAMLVYGVGYGLATLSCVLPVFLVAVGAAASSSLADRVAGLAGFSLGIASVLVLVSLSATFLDSGAVRFRAIAPVIPVLSGLLLLGAAIYIAHREIPLAAIALRRNVPAEAVTLALTAVIVVTAATAGLIVARRQRARLTREHDVLAAEPRGEMSRTRNRG